MGIPHEIIEKKSGQAYRAKVLSLDRTRPSLGAKISTWAYPLHCHVRDLEGNEILQLQPAFYDGALQEIYADKGPSTKLQLPYYLTNVHLHGGSSGRPVFNENGHVFGIACCSYEGAEDIAFVTPIDAILEIELEDVDLRDGRGPRRVCVAEIARLGRIAIR
jgi:hypothetical protein